MGGGGLKLGKVPCVDTNGCLSNGTEGGGGAEEVEEGRGGKEARRQSGKTLFFLSSLLITTAPPTLTQFINNAECSAPRCCEVFVNGHANCNKQQRCLSHPAGTTLLIRMTWIDGTKERGTKTREAEGDGEPGEDESKRKALEGLES